MRDRAGGLTVPNGNDQATAGERTDERTNRVVAPLAWRAWQARPRRDVFAREWMTRGRKLPSHPHCLGAPDLSIERRQRNGLPVLG